jgi:anti-sigma regulatory factor (Ser/Thr protein kinase)
MESFLDRLLAQDAAVPAAPPGMERSPTEPGGGGPTDASRAVPVDEHEVVVPSAPRGPGAPRIAIYDTLTSPPRVVEVEEKDVPALIASLSEKTYHSCREQGGTVPYTVITELIENLIHARFRDVVITILDGGRVVRISDHGPGVADKERAFEPGFTTATADQRLFIRGVGSGLPMARESLAFLSGVVTFEDNLGGGSVVTVKMPRQAPATAPRPHDAPSVPRLTIRQKRVLALLMEVNAAGPTAVARELHTSPATAHRELHVLGQMGLVDSLGDGKRALTEDGMALLERLF